MSFSLAHSISTQYLLLRWIEAETPSVKKTSNPEVSKSLSILDPGPMSAETLLSNATKLNTNLPEQNHEHVANDGRSTTPDTPRSSEQRTRPTPVTPIPIDIDEAHDNNVAADSHNSSRDYLTLDTRGLSAVLSLTGCPAFDLEPLENSIAEHRAATVRVFHGKGCLIRLVTYSTAGMIRQYLLTMSSQSNS